LSEIEASGELDLYQPFHAALADLYARNKNDERAKTSYQRAIKLSQNQLEKQFLQDKLDQLQQRTLH